MADFARSDHPAVQEQLDRLEKLSAGGDRLGLERITHLLERLGRPQEALPPVFHVAGTNGKGSVCAFLRAGLEAASRSVHMFTSPHLVRFNERIRLAGSLIADEPLAGLLAKVLDVSEGIEPSFFEVTTATAFLAFSRVPADAAIVEVGLGGRLDATNVIDRPLVCGITSLGIDHQQFLGRRLADIAGEKAGIAKRGVPLLTEQYPRQIAARIGEVAANAGAIWMPLGGSWDSTVRQGKLRYRDRSGELDLPVPRLPGRHQAHNAALAVAMLRHQERLEVPPSAFGAAMGWANWPARMQRLSDGPLTSLLPAGSELLVDGGHNPSAARAISAFARRSFDDRLRTVLVFASLASKDAERILSPFAGIAPEVRTVPIPGHDHHEPRKLARMARSLGFHAVAHETLGDAIRSVARPSRVLVFGSLYLAGEALRANRQAPD